MQYLLSRGDICRKLRSLSISLSWHNGNLSAANIGFDDADFFDPLKAGFVHVLRACPQLTDLSLTALRFSLDLAEALASLRSLRGVTLFGMMATTELWEAALEGTLPHNPSVVELSLSTSHHGSWAFLALFPKLVTLGMRSSDGVRLLQLTDVHDRLHVFERLQRLCVSNFGNRDASDVGPFTVWLHSLTELRPTGTLPLTHLCLAPAVPIKDEDRDAVMSLLPVLPALEALVLECVQHLRPADVARLVQACPRRLRALTLTLKPNRHHKRAVPCIWPGGGFEYAAALAPLVNLRLFRWNSYVGVYDPAPGWDLVHFDESYDDAPPRRKMMPMEADPWDVEWQGYGKHCMAAEARMFAAMLPALEHLIWIGGQERYPIDSFCCIARSDGRTEVKTYVGWHSPGRPSKSDFAHAYLDASHGGCWPMPESQGLRRLHWSLEDLLE
jgi:hypothetical protein